MLRTIGLILGVILIIVFLVPFARDLYHRYQLGQQLNSVMDLRERVEFQQWGGSSQDFAKRLLDRCELSQGKGAVQCERYRSAIE